MDDSLVTFDRIKLKLSKWNQQSQGSLYFLSCFLKWTIVDTLLMSSLFKLLRATKWQGCLAALFIAWASLKSPLLLHGMLTNQIAWIKVMWWQILKRDHVFFYKYLDSDYRKISSLWKLKQQGSETLMQNFYKVSVFLREKFKNS